jgi:serine/threonine-protein kinase
MTPDDWRRVRDLFERALEQPSPVSDEWLAREAGDAAVAAEASSLLREHARAGGFLETPIGARLPRLDDEDRFQPGVTVGPYVIAREIGRGGMGRVYLATDTRLGRQVALKVLAPDLVRKPGERERLRREARAAAALNAPGICTVYALEEIDDDVLLAEEYVDGVTLRQVIDAGPKPSPAELLGVARELATALAAAHGRGITHRDLKPENVMRTGSGSLKVLDFGLSFGTIDGQPEQLRVTTPGTLVGTPAYMAPEQLDGGAADPRSDVFAVGILLFELATGVHPFAATSVLATTARILEGEPMPLATMRPDLPAAFVAIVERCLRKAPSDRYADAGDLLRALASPAPHQAVARSSGWWRRHMASAIALYLAAVGTGWLAKEWQHAWAGAAFVLLAMLATIGGVLRGHLLFGERMHDPAIVRRELRRVFVPLTAIDLAIATVLVVDGLGVAIARAVPGVIIIGLGIGIALARLVLERTTTEVEFGADA